jgi:hypothetical protein
LFSNECDLLDLDKDGSDSNFSVIV